MGARAFFSWRLVPQRIEQAVDVLGRLGAALRREAGGLVEDERLQILVDNHVAGEGDLVVAPGCAFALGACFLGTSGFGGGDAERLARSDPVARRRARAIDAELARARPFGDEG